MPYKLCTAEDVKQLTKGASVGDFDYALAEILIPAVGALFAKYCSRPDFDKASRVEYLSPRANERRLFLSSPPVAAAEVGPPAIEALKLYYDTATPRAYGATTELVSGTDFFVHEAQGIVEHVGSGFGTGFRTVKVTYTGGYLTGHGIGCPDDLRLAAITQVKIFFDRREQYGVSGQSLEGGSISLLNILTLPKQVTMLLDAYRVFGSSA